MSKKERMVKMLAYLDGAALMAEKAEALNGQPLFRDGEGYPVDVVKLLCLTAEQVNTELQRVKNEGG